MLLVDIVYWSFLFLVRNLPLFCFCAVAGQYFYNRFLHPLSKVPGPVLASFSKVWFLWHGYAGRQHEVHIECHEKYGHIFRAMPNFVMVNDPQCIQQVYKYDRSDYFLPFEISPGDISIAGIQSMKEHNIRKRKLAAAYSMKSLLESETYMDDRENEFISKIREHVSSNPTGKVIDLGQWLHWLAMDVVMDLSFGEPIGFIKQGKDVRGLIQSVHDLFVGANFMVNLPGLVRFLQTPWIWRFVAPKPTDMKGPGALQGVSNEAVRKRLQNGNSKNRRDLLQQFLEYRDQDGRPLSPKEINLEALTPVEAGSDSTSATMRAAILFIATNPPVYNKLMAELLSAEASGKVSRPIKYQEAQALPYLQAVIKESMRIHPAVGVPLPRVVPAGGAMLGGLFLPEGTWVGMAPWAVNHSKEVFGEDAHVFRPERWLESEEKSKYWDKIDVTFGSGYCVCLGKNIALMETYKTVVELFRNFDVMIANPSRPWIAINAMGFIHKDFLVRLVPRETRP